MKPAVTILWIQAVFWETFAIIKEYEGVEGVEGYTLDMATLAIICFGFASIIHRMDKNQKLMEEPESDDKVGLAPDELSYTSPGGHSFTSSDGSTWILDGNHETKNEVK